MRPSVAAAAAVLALEPLLRAAVGAATGPHPRAFEYALFDRVAFRIFARDVWANDARLRACGEAGPAVIFTGGSPNLDLDEAFLAEKLSPAGVAPCVLPFQGGVRPLELNAYLPELSARRPRALVLHVGPPSFSPFDAATASRLVYFGADRALPLFSPEERWAARRLALRSLLSRASLAYRYRVMARARLWPGRYLSPPGGTRAPAGLAFDRGRQLAFFEEFLRRWKETGIPLVVWDSPRDPSWQLPGRLTSGAEERAFVSMVREACRKAGVRFAGAKELPRFPVDEFRSATHLTPAGGRRLTLALAAIVRRELAPSLRLK